MSKLTSLVALAAGHDVPPFIGLSSQRLAGLWHQGEDILSRTGSVLASIRNTSGAFLGRHLDELSQLHDTIRWLPDAADTLLGAEEARGLELARGLAVRSSDDIEDSSEGSLAGMFLTELDVQRPQPLLDAVLRVWRSAFRRSVLVEKLRLQRLGEDSALSMSVIVQNMVNGVASGVAFSHNPSDPDCVLVEAVRGRGDGLVCGRSLDWSLSIDRNDLDRAVADRAVSIDQRRLAEAGAAAAALHQRLGTAVDIEWTHDGVRLWLLQARPVVARRDAGTGQALFEAVDLYHAEEAELQGLRPLPEFAQYFRAKRRPLVTLATREGARSGEALVVRCNRPGLARQAAEGSLFKTWRSEQVVLDFSQGLRQLVMDRGDLEPFLLENLSLATPTTFVVREYVRGDAGMISYVSINNGRPVVACEHSADGLLALNRGTAATTAFELEGYQDLLDGRQTAAVRATTLAANRELGRVQVEWVVAGPDVIALDYSHINAMPPMALDASDRIISQGAIIGTAVRVAESRDLNEMSTSARVSMNDIPAFEEMGPAVNDTMQRIRTMTTPPVIVVSRPYAALAALLPHVSGFIFERSSMLCHLAILLRERGIPAVASSRLFESIETGQTLALQGTGAT